MPADPGSRRIVPLGDSALLVEFGTTIDAAVNARVLAFAAGLAARRITGIRDIVPAYSAVAVHFDPLRTRAEEIESAVSALLREPIPLEDPASEVVDLPCVYGGEGGPDLPGVAAWAGCTEAEVVARHAGRVYRVCMIGFLPGFPYMAEVDAAIAAPRHATPRLTVAAGSIGIAGRQTGVYPVASPGGWQIIGRTSARLFDAARTPPSRLQPGMRVRFVPADPDALESPPGVGW
jgi:KipI family sensor histidine kinase inhibitor